MPPRRSGIFRPRVGLDSRFSGGPPLTIVNGKNVQPAKRVKASSVMMKEDSDPLYDPITAPPESSEDEAETTPVQQPTANDDHDSDEHYEKHRTADIRGTKFGKATSSTESNTRPLKSKFESARANDEKSYSSTIDEPPSLAGSKRPAEEDQLKGVGRLKKELEASRKKKNKSLMKYGSQYSSQQKLEKRNPTSTSRDYPTSSPPQDIAQPISAKSTFHRVKSISPLKSPSPRKSFKPRRQISDFDEPEDPKPKFKNIPRHGSSPFSTPGKHRLRHMSPIDKSVEDKNPKSANPTSKGLRNSARTNRSLRRSSSKGGKPPNPIAEEASQRPVFKMPGSDDLDPFDDDVSLDATVTPMESQDTSWDHLEIDETESLTIPRCPMCYQEVDRELLEKHSTHGKMSVKQQTAFCRLHKRQSAAKAGAEKGYPDIDWDSLDSRLSSHQDFLQNILEGSQSSHYRDVLKERVDSGKNRTLLTSYDNLTPGYYGPRGLQVMTQFIMRTLSDVIRRRAVEDKLISARSYTGYVQTVLVPELAVRLIMEDISITEESAREVLKESVEIGELLYEEARDVVMINEQEEDTFLEI
ncbi:RTC4-like domain-containing protein [Xylaria digitata]|nr:RTC4-like domain-containing protein [Xylaria digitata]